MKKEEKQNLQTNMKDVIDTSKTIRDILLSKEMSHQEKANQLPFFKEALNANKNIVSATITSISLSKLKDE
jgi:hypothetical protein